MRTRTSVRPTSRVQRGSPDRDLSPVRPSAEQDRFSDNLLGPAPKKSANARGGCALVYRWVRAATRFWRSSCVGCSRHVSLASRQVALWGPPLPPRPETFPQGPSPLALRPPPPASPPRRGRVSDPSQRGPRTSIAARGIVRRCPSRGRRSGKERGGKRGDPGRSLTPNLCPRKVSGEAARGYGRTRARVSAWRSDPALPSRPHAGTHAESVARAAALSRAPFPPRPAPPSQRTPIH